MYIIKQTNPNSLAFKTYEGWDVFPEGKPIELGNVMRFTKREAELNPLGNGQEYLYFGCYKALDAVDKTQAIALSRVKFKNAYKELAK